MITRVEESTSKVVQQHSKGMSVTHTPLSTVEWIAVMIDTQGDVSFVRFEVTCVCLVMFSVSFV